MEQDAAIGSALHQEIELHAYALWEDRGSPFGSPEVDWFRAESEIKARGAEPESPLESVARTIGSALGTVASLVVHPKS